MPSVMSKVITSTGAVNTGLTSDTSSLSELNFYAQEAAVVAGTAAALPPPNPAAFVVAVTVEQAALVTATAVFANDATTLGTHFTLANLGTVIGDIATVAGDTTLIVGAIANLVPGGQVVAASAAGIGDALTILGVIASQAGNLESDTSATVYTVLTEASQGLQKIDDLEPLFSDAFDTASTGIAEAWSSAGGMLLTTVDGLSDALSATKEALTSGVSDIDTTGLVSSTNTLNGDLGGLATSTGVVPVDTTTDATGTGVDVSQTDGSVLIGIGGIDNSSDGSTTYVTTSSPSGSVELKGTDVLDSQGHVSNTLQLFDASGVLLTKVDSSYSPDGSSITTTYAGNGDKASVDVENSDGTSQLTSYGSDGSSTEIAYPDPNGTGAPVSKDVENSNGTSQITSYGTDGSSTTITYSGPSGTGAPVTRNIENLDGTSQITNYGTDGSSTTITYSGPNGTGSPVVTNVTGSDGVASLTFSAGSSSVQATLGPIQVGMSPVRLYFDSSNNQFYSDYTLRQSVVEQLRYVGQTGYDPGGVVGVTILPNSSSFQAVTPYLDIGVNKVVSASGNFFIQDTEGVSGVYENVPVPLKVHGYVEYTDDNGRIISANSAQEIDILVSAKVYDPAVAVLSTGSLNFGALHVGDTASKDITVSNITAGALTDQLIGGLRVSQGYSATQLNGIPAGGQGRITITLNTTQAGNISGYGLTNSYYGYQGLVSHDPDLPDIDAPTNLSSVSLTGTVYNYALPSFVKLGGSGVLSGSGAGWTLNLGNLAQSSDDGTATIALVNAAPGSYSDDLSGTLVAGGAGFGITGTGTIGTLTAGSAYAHDLTLSADTTQPGFHTEAITLNPVGSNAGGYLGALPAQTLTVADFVSTPGTIGIYGILDDITDSTVLNGVNQIKLAGGATLDIGTRISSPLSIDFGNTNNNLVIDDPDSFGSDDDGTYSGPTLQNFYAGDTVDFKGIEFVASQTTETYSEDTGVLKIANGPKISYVSFGGGNNVVDDPFHITSDGNGGTLLTNDAAPCYCPGTLIATEKGKVAVEDLRIGDRVLTVHGASQPIKWIGRRAYEGRFVSDNHLILPVTVKAGALAPNIPYRDLHLSPGHALYLDGVLVPAWRLVNGVSIIQATAVEEVAYLQVELHEHDVIWAEGTPAETFFDNGCRDQFQNAAEFHALYPEPQPTPRMCAPRIEQGFQLQAIQQRLAERAFIAPNHHPRGSLQGFVDVPGPDRVHGWAQDEASPEEPVCLDILLDGRRVMRVLANLYRADLRKAGLGSGCHAFEVPLPDGVCGCVEVRRSADGGSIARTGAAEALATALTA